MRALSLLLQCFPWRCNRFGHSSHILWPACCPSTIINIRYPNELLVFHRYVPGNVNLNRVRSSFTMSYVSIYIYIYIHSQIFICWLSPVYAFGDYAIESIEHLTCSGFPTSTSRASGTDHVLRSAELGQFEMAPSFSFTADLIGSAI